MSSRLFREPSNPLSKENIMKSIAKFVLIIALTSSTAGATARSTMPAPQDSQSTNEFKAANLDMMKNMNVPYTGNPDVDFRTHMIPHHQGAIAMAKIVLKYAKDEETKKLAQKIIEAQEKEVADMQGWLEKNGH
jgi:uncharacterized protein (DUF305 family)